MCTVIDLLRALIEEQRVLIKAKRDGVINPQNCNFNSFLRRKILMLSKRHESTEVARTNWFSFSIYTRFLKCAH